MTTFLAAGGPVGSLMTRSLPIPRSSDCAARWELHRGSDAPSPVGVRPWNLRGAQVMSGRDRPPLVWRYDHDRQLAITLDGRLMTEVIAAEPTADSKSDLDGDEGKSEDWTYDFCPDDPGTTV